MTLLLRKMNDIVQYPTSSDVPELSILSKVVQYPFEYDSVRIFALIISSVLIGYTLQPVPKWLNKLFDTNNIFKFIIILISCLIALYPFTPTKLVYCIIFTSVSLILFEYARKLDETEQNESKKI